MGTDLRDLLGAGLHGRATISAVAIPAQFVSVAGARAAKKDFASRKIGELPLENSRIDGKVARRKATKDDLVKARGVGVDKKFDGSYGDDRRLLKRIAVNAGADRWKRHAPQAFLVSDFERAAIA